MAGLDLGEFPLSSSRVPDAETQAKAFLAKHPEADGRGIVIAVMDTGCDPGAPGLRTTSTGLPKIIDCVDCTGSGDVDTSTVIEVSSGRLESPYTGRSLKLGSGDRWANPTGKWHIGVKRAYELFDQGLAKRVKSERKATWDLVHRGYASEACRRLAEFDKAHPKPEGERARERKDLEDRIAQLSALQKEHEDVGVMLDVLCWHDGKVWRAALGSREDGDLSDAPALANFALEHEWASMGELEQMNYCLNVYDEGSLVSVVCDISSHGTHVAGIAAACHPAEPERNGVAPGAQVVSLKIGDTRLDGMETGTGLARAFAHCVKAKVDLINLSFGEGASPAATGRIIELAKRTVAQHGIIFVTSAGNSGPALSTIGAPGNGSDVFVTIGAHVSPPAMEAQYSMLEKVPATPYTWTSRGPTQDGSLGVTVCAPGSAITSIPNWTLAGARLMNGTSMAAPNACGCLALVLSALKAAGIPWSPASVHRAAKASALALPGADPFAVGAGMVQVDACFEYLAAHGDLPYRDVTLSVEIPGRGRGLLLREPHEAAAPRTFSVKVEPCFRELDPSLNRAKIEMELNLALTSTASWVQVPQFVVLPSSGRMFNIKVDPTGLPEGAVHLARVRGFDTARPAAGALFEVPITVVRPAAPVLCPARQRPAVLERKGIRFSPGHIERTFIAVPPGCTWAEFTVTVRPFDGGARLLILHVLQDMPHLPGSQTTEDFDLVFRVAGVQKRTFRVEAEGTLEVTLAQNWSSLGATEADLEVSFSGIMPDSAHVSLSSGNPLACVYATAGPGAAMLKPSAALGALRATLRPSSAQIQPGGERDLYPEGKRVYEMVLEYPLKLDEDAEVTPQALLLNDKLYESVYESQLIMIHDQSKRFVACTDAWPTPVRLKKGDYVARLQLRHDDSALLERMKHMPLCIDRKLDKEIAVKAYPDFNSAVVAQGDFKSAEVRGGERKAVFFALAVDEKLPDYAKPGDILMGKVSYGEPSVPSKGKKSRGGFTVQFAVAAPKPQEKKEEEKEDDPRTDAEKLEHSVRDAKIKHLETMRKWSSKDEHAKMLDSLLAAHPGHLPLLQERLLACEEIKNPDKELASQGEPARLQSVIDAADQLLAAVDLTALAMHLGRRVDKDDKEAVRRGKELDKAKDAVIDALSKKVLALAQLAREDAGSWKEQLFVAYKALAAWVDLGDAKYSRLAVAHERAAGRLGSALAALNKQIGEERAPRQELLEERAALLGELGWDGWAERERRSWAVRYPKSYARL